MTFADSKDTDEAQQNVGPHLKSQLFDTEIIYRQSFDDNNDYFCNFGESKKPY